MKFAFVDLFAGGIVHLLPQRRNKTISGMTVGVFDSRHIGAYMCS